MDRLGSRPLILLLLILSLLLPSSCARITIVTAWPLLPKLVRYHKANIVAYGYQESSFERVWFSRIEIGNPQAPFSGSPILWLRLADGTLLRTDRLDLAVLRDRKDRSWRIQSPGMLIDAGWRPGSEEIHVGGFRFLVESEEVVWLAAASSWDLESSAPAPEIGNAEGSIFYRLPLMQQQLIELLGEPDTISTDLADLL